MDFKVVNVNYIEEVCDNSKELIIDMVNIFREQVSEFATEMKNLYNDGRYYDLGLMAHKAKSSIAIMGMEDMAVKLKELELNAKEGKKQETYPDYIEDFIEQTDLAVKELDSYIKSL